MSKSFHETGLEVAIIGVSGRFPQAPDVAAFWKNLSEQQDCISRFEREEMLQAGWSAEKIDKPGFVKAKGVVPDVYQFDAGFFGYSAREAAIMDPQMRAFHQLAYHALENAGYAPQNCKTLVGVYAGAGNNPFWISRHLSKISNSFAENYEISSLNGREFLATRIAYKLNLKGPAVTVQTACSTSLVAVHNAVSGLLAGECDMALAGGVAIHTSDINGRADVGGYQYQEGMILSPDGHCRAFDEGAQGTVPGDGMGLVVLKRLKDAQRDGDNLLAVIKGSAINNDGSNKVGYTAPSVEGQSRVIYAALQFAEVEPESISYIETHGTGTPLGDAIEIEALRKIYGHLPEQSIRIGSVKTNIGHLDAAAGIAGLIKTVMAMQHQQLPASLNYQNGNSKTGLSRSPFKVNHQNSTWQSEGEPLRAAVSSFGIGGTNAHVILEQYSQPTDNSVAADKPLVFTWSGKTEKAAQAWQQVFREHLRLDSHASLQDIAYTLLQGRTHHEHRSMLVAEGRQQLLELLAEDSGAVLTSKATAAPKKILFMFSGQGSQFATMARQLYLDFPLFKRELDKCIDLAQPKFDISLQSLLLDENQSEQNKALIHQTNITQPMLFMVEYATAKLLMSFGVQPSAMVGHSLGEYVAACLAGVIKLEDAMALVTERGKLMASTSEGAMLSVALSEEKVLPLLNGQLSLAAVNSSEQCVVSGETNAIAKLEDRLKEQQVKTTRLNVSNAYHSYLMDEILPAFTELLGTIQFHPPTIPYYSNVTGKLITAEQAQSVDYWLQHLRGCVRFNDAITAALAEPQSALIEVGPGRTLSTFASRNSAKITSHIILNALRHASDEQNDSYKLLVCLGRLHIKGVKLDWSTLLDPKNSKRVPLPGYVFDESEYIPETLDPLIKVANEAETHRQVKLYQPQWTPSPLPVSASAVKAGSAGDGTASETIATQKSIIAFWDNNGVVENAMALLQEQGNKKLVTVETGDHYEQICNGHYRLNPASQDDIGLFVDELIRIEAVPDTIVYGFGLDELSSLSQEQQADSMFYGLVFLCQALVHKMGNEQVNVTVATRQRFNVSGAESIEPFKSLIQGPLRVIPHEFASIRTKAVDFGLFQKGRSAQREARQLMAEQQHFQQQLEQKNAADVAQTVAYRADVRWQLVHQAVDVPAVSETLSLNYLVENGIYLITGGIGGIGLTLAEHFSSQQKVNLVLTTRRRFPAPENFASYLDSQNTDSDIVAAINAIERIGNSGSKVSVMTADVTSEDNLHTLKAQIESCFGKVTGIVHAAGLPGGGSMLHKQKSDMQNILAAKVSGTEALTLVFASHKPDFIVLSSSVTAILGGFGQLDYCAANAWQDAWAEAHKNHENTRFISINWDNWQDIGMAADKGRNQTYDSDLLGRLVERTGFDIAYRQTYKVEAHWALREHWILGVPTLPGTSYLNMVAMALNRANVDSFTFKEVTFLSPLVLNEEEQAQVATLLKRTEEGFEFLVSSEELEHAKGRVTINRNPVATLVNVEDVLARCSDKFIDNPEDIAHLSRITSTVEGKKKVELVEFGERWRNLKWIRLGQKEGVAQLSLPAKFDDDFAQLPLHPALLDCATAFLRPFHYEGIFLPLSYGEMIVYRPLTSTFYSHARLLSSNVSGDKGVQSFDVTLFDEKGHLLAEIKRFTLREVDQSSISRSLSHKKSDNSGENAHYGLRDTGLSNAEALQAFDQIMQLDTSNVAVAWGDIDQRIRQYDNFLKDQRVGSTQKAPRPDLDVAYVKPKTETEIKLAEMLQQIMALKTVGVHDDFFELGGDSLLLVQFHKLLQENFEKKVSVADLYEMTTIRKIAAALTGDKETNKNDAVSRAVSRSEKQKAARGRRSPSRQQ
jgi:acyl transferase domain-containing protein/acyl carrier protein